MYAVSGRVPKPTMFAAGIPAWPWGAGKKRPTGVPALGYAAGISVRDSGRSGGRESALKDRFGAVPFQLRYVLDDLRVLVPIELLLSVLFK